MFHEPSHAEIGKCCLSSFIDIDVFWTDITMVHLLLMSFLQGISHVEHDTYLICLLECLLTQFASEGTLVLIAADLIIIGLLLIHPTLCFHNEWRRTYFLLSHICILHL